MGFSIMWAVLSIVFLTLAFLLHKKQLFVGGIGGAAAVVLSLFTEFVLTQIVIFALVCGISFLIGFIFVRLNHPKNCSVESAIGERCTVVERVNNLAGSGEVKIGRNVWSARSVYDDLTFECGDQVLVVAVEGVKLICKKAE